MYSDEWISCTFHTILRFWIVTDSKGICALPGLTIFDPFRFFNFCSFYLFLESVHTYFIFHIIELNIVEFKS